MIPSQVLDQDCCFFDQRGIRILTAKTGLGRGKRRIRKRDPRQACDLLGSRPSNSAAISQ